ncbi:chitin synthase 2 [Ramicandelaber brevisporus]|nr:chitin synthase 2 [Ramicandelaber brevisporus]
MADQGYYSQTPPPHQQQNQYYQQHQQQQPVGYSGTPVHMQHPLQGNTPGASASPPPGSHHPYGGGHMAGAGYTGSTASLQAGTSVSAPQFYPPSAAGGHHGGYDPSMSLPPPSAPFAGGVGRPSTPNPEPRLAITPSASQMPSNVASPVPRPKINPMSQPVMDDQIRQLYDADSAPPPEARRFNEFQEARQRRFKQVELTSGNLVVDSPVPQRLRSVLALDNHQEFTHVRYTACTCDPNEFANERYTLRPAIYGRQTELLFVLTMYNEDEILFNRTFTAVMKNIAHLTSRTSSKTWGKDSWKKVVVCIVSDGRTKIHPRTLQVLGLIGVYQEGLAQNSVDGEPVTAHIYEYTTQVTFNSRLEMRGPKEGLVPCQVIFCLKEKNAKKINSHRWFFNAFSPILNPKVCVLIDVGTKPTDTSIYHLWAAFKNPQVAGACGEIAADLDNGKNLINPLVATQNFEYKMSNILDKPLESVFGYISVLPGAFSAYRYDALKNSAEGVGPLASYFKGELMHSGDADSSIFEANMYLAEDRILCFELVAKRNCNYVLKYVKGARAYTDVPDALPELISQRRRWLNGSFFAAIYATAHWYKLFNSSHSFPRLLLFMVEFIYQTVSLIFSWFALGNFYLTFHFLTKNVSEFAQKADPFFGAGDTVFTITNILYMLALCVQFVLSLGNRPQGTRFIYWGTVILFTIIMLVMFYTAVYSVVFTLTDKQFKGKTAVQLFQNDTFRDIILSLASTYGLYIVSSILYLDPWHMITSFLQYMLLLPSFVNILMVYAFCNIHDVSWGTKGDTGTSSDLGHAKVEKKAGASAVANVQVANDEADIEESYAKMYKDLKTPPPKVKAVKSPADKREDANRKFRTTLVLSWMFTNALLIFALTSKQYDNWALKHSKGSNRIFNPYLTFIFWSVCGLSAVRFVGSVLYLMIYYTIG